VRIENAAGTRREKFSRRATYDYQLEAFAAAVEDGAPFPTTAVDAIRTMELIDATYVAAGLPIRRPTPVSPTSPTDDTSAAGDARDPTDWTDRTRSGDPTPSTSSPDPTASGDPAGD
jgi:hypothetical protein